ncbi:MAG: hypothetical protein AAGF23_22220, partial [Acidobacteriota bacterium]
MKDRGVDDWELLDGDDGDGASEEALQRWLDGDLDAAAAESLVRRMAEEPGLRDEVQAAARLRRRVTALPSTLEPQRDLWAGVAERLDAGPATDRSGPQRGIEPRHGLGGRPRRGAAASPAWRHALAAVFGVALGAAATL